MELGSLFVGFHSHGPTEQLIIVAEIGIMALSRDAEVNWTIGTDIISGIVWSDQAALVKQFDGPYLKVDLLNGAVIPAPQESDSP